MIPMVLMYVMWALWRISWAVASRWSLPTDTASKTKKEIIYHIATSLGPLVLVFSWGGILVSDIIGWICSVVTAAGFSFTWWARVHLGLFWSGSIEKKTGHKVVDTGPYALVRHPIYVGLLVVALAMLVAKMNWIALLGFGITAWGLWSKSKLEENFLGDEYVEYRKRVR